jgi:hypothetical protein
MLELLALFNAQKSDLPDNLLHNSCVFRLNGRAYHEHLGRPPADPLVRLIGCGPAGYRFLLTAVRYTMDEPRLTIDEHSLAERDEDDERSLSVRATVTGALRGGDDRFESTCQVEARAGADGRLRELSVMMGDADVARLIAARHR